MTDCRTTRDWILEVDPEELEQAGSERLTQQAIHLAACPKCRSLADEILKAEAALRANLDSVEPTQDVEAALSRAREAHQAGESHRAKSRRRRWRVALPLAAAALAGLLLLGRPLPVSDMGFDPATLQAARALGLVGPQPVVRAGSNERVAVLPTENPNITIIWFLE